MCQVDRTKLSRATYRPVWATVSTLGESEILHSEIPHKRDVSWCVWRWCQRMPRSQRTIARVQTQSRTCSPNMWWRWRMSAATLGNFLQKQIFGHVRQFHTSNRALIEVRVDPRRRVHTNEYPNAIRN